MSVGLAQLLNIDITGPTVPVHGLGYQYGRLCSGAKSVSEASVRAWAFQYGSEHIPVRYVAFGTHLDSGVQLMMPSRRETRVNVGQAGVGANVRDKHIPPPPPP
ncbi:hypothetical protein V6N11_065160 [Hibiscus sabdariffa]|uniref:Uncharacterized protein n=2 Tax=Hibiscus sabdariffa TaxID=183260 RepID=A0ABR2QGQ5_9ROSI